MAIRYFEWQGHEVSVDMKEQILRLELAPFASLKEACRGATRIIRDLGGMEIATFDHDQKFEAPLASSVVALPDEGGFVSAGVFAQKAKAVDDGIVAALELIIDDGTFDLAGRRAFLAQLQEHLLSEWATSEKDAGLAEAIGLISAARSIVDGADADSSIASDTGLRLRRSPLERISFGARNASADGDLFLERASHAVVPAGQSTSKTFGRPGCGAPLEIAASRPGAVGRVPDPALAGGVDQSARPTGSSRRHAVGK